MSKREIKTPAPTGMTCISCRLMFSDRTFTRRTRRYRRTSARFLVTPRRHCSPVASTFTLFFIILANAQRDHYRSDLHRFNLKRKVAQLPPLTNAEFRQRMKGASHIVFGGLAHIFRLYT